MDPRVIEAVCAELADTAETAVSSALGALPVGFPSALAESVAGGVRSRLREIERFL